MLLEPNPEKKYRVPGLEELIDQGFLFLVAGSDTTAYSLACATYYILTHKEVLERLTAELRQDYSRTVSNPDWNYINQLPYLVSGFPLTRHYGQPSLTALGPDCRDQRKSPSVNRYPRDITTRGA